MKSQTDQALLDVVDLRLELLHGQLLRLQIHLVLIGLSWAQTGSKGLEVHHAEAGIKVVLGSPISLRFIPK